ncbi:regulator [Acinetobacter baumannii]|nr:regulator [Acinetobacter baumannii]
MTQFVLDPAKLMETAANKQNAIRSREKTLKPKDGSNRYVLLPGWGWKQGKQDVWFHDFGMHFIKDANGDLQSTYVCLDKTFGKDYPICGALKQAANIATTEAQVEALKECGSRQTYLMNVLALDSDRPNDPQILEVPKTVFSAIFDVLAKWGARLFDPNGSQVIVINRNGSGMNTKYTVLPDAETKPVPPQVYEKLNNLDEYVSQENDERLQRSLGHVQQVVGLLPPAQSNDTPRTAPAAIGLAAGGAAQPAYQQTAEEISYTEVTQPAQPQTVEHAPINLNTDLEALLDLDIPV